MSVTSVAVRLCLFKQKTAYEMRISDWSSDVCSSDLLHFHDIEHLLSVLHKLRDEGNTVVVIEHNLDVIKTADWVIDLGPEGGSGGGQIIASGTPEYLCTVPQSFTGQFLARRTGIDSAPTDRKSVVEGKSGDIR